MKACSSLPVGLGNSSPCPSAPVLPPWHTVAPTGGRTLLCCEQNEDDSKRTLTQRTPPVPGAGWEPTVSDALLRSSRHSLRQQAAPSKETCSSSRDSAPVSNAGSEADWEKMTSELAKQLRSEWRHEFQSELRAVRAEREREAQERDVQAPVEVETMAGEAVDPPRERRSATSQDSADAAVRRLEAELVEMQGQNERLKKELDRSRADLDRETVLCVEARSGLERAELELLKLRQEGCSVTSKELEDQLDAERRNSGRYREEVRILTIEKQALDVEFEAMVQRCDEMRAKEACQECCRWQRKHAQLAKEKAELEKHVQDQRSDLESEFEAMARCLGEMKGKENCQECSRWQKKHTQLSKEKAGLEKTVQDMRSELLSIEGQLRQERNVPSPGEFLRLVNDSQPRAWPQHKMELELALCRAQQDYETVARRLETLEKQTWRCVGTS